MKLPKLVGLSGRKRSGKSTAASLLQLRHGYREVSFAAPLREFVAQLIGCSVAAMDERKEDPHAVLGGRTPRYAMQTIGTEWGRSMIAADLWVRVARQRIDRMLDHGELVVVSDVRFPNEAQMIRRLGGVIVDISRPGGETGDTHVSEAPLPADLIDASIENAGTRGELRQRLVGALVALERGV